MLPLAHPEPNETPATLHDQVLKVLQGGRRKFATVAAGGLVCLVAFHVVFGANGLTAFEAKRRQNALLTQQINDLKAENEKLAEHNARLQSSDAAIEEAIRRHLHFTRQDEIILSVPEAPAAPAR
jgi:cell division protein FtsB